MQVPNYYQIISDRLSNIESLLIDIKHRSIPETPYQPVNVAPVLSSKQVQEMTGWPPGTFYAKVAEMPEGVVIRKSKRLLFDREKLMGWLQTPTKP